MNKKHNPQTNKTNKNQIIKETDEIRNIPQQQQTTQTSEQGKQANKQRGRLQRKTQP